MELPLEIIAHIGNLADIKTTLALRSTCHACLAVISNKQFIIYNIHPQNVHSVLKPLRHLNHISIEIKNIGKKTQPVDSIVPIFKELACLDINQLNIESYKQTAGALSHLQHLNNLQSLTAIGPNMKALNLLTNLTRLKVTNTVARFDKLTKLQDLHVGYFTSYGSDELQLKTTNLTQLVVENTYLFVDYIDKTRLYNLKSLVVHETYDDVANLLPHLHALESLTTDSRVTAQVMSAMTRLTRLELSKKCFGKSEEDYEDLSSYSKLTKLKVLNINNTVNRLVKSISFVSKLPLVSATISGVTRDDAECIQYFKPHLIKELDISINNTSMFKNELTRLTRLESLKVCSSTPLLVGGIDTLTLLTRLVLVKSQCKSFERLTRLKILHVDMTNSSTVLGWTALTNLEELNATINPELIEDVTRLVKLNDLMLDFKGSFESDALSSLTNLTRLCLPSRDYPTLDWLALLTNLQHLDLKTSRITMRDVVALTCLKELTYLSVLNASKYSDELRVLSKLSFE